MRGTFEVDGGRRRRARITAAVGLVLAVGCLLSLCAVTTCSSMFGGGGGDHYWTHGCVTPDETTLAMVGDEVALIDLASGASRTRYPRYLDDVVCFPNGEIVGLSRAEALWLATKARTTRRGARDVVAPVGDRRILVTWRPTGRHGGGSRRDIYSGPLELNVETVDGVSAPVTRVEPDQVAGAGTGPISLFRTQIAGVLPTGEVLVAAGFEPSIRRASVTDWQDGRARALHRVTVGSGAIVAASGALGPAESQCLLDGFPLTRRSALGANGSSLIVACPASEGSMTLLRLTLPSGVGQVLATIDGRESSALSLSADGSLAAVATVAVGGQSGKLSVVEIETGRLLWQSEPMPGSIYVARFLSDGTLVLATSEQVVQRRDARTGAMRWAVSAAP
jgi:hypothetical protein